VRELANTIERAAILGDGEVLRAEDLPSYIVRASAPVTNDAGYHESVREFKRALITGALSEAAGSQTEAAKRLGLNPTYLSKLIKNLRVKT